MATDQTALTEALAFCPELARVVLGGRSVGRTGRTFPGDSVSTSNNLITLRNLMMAWRPERTLEIGLALGASALLFTCSHRDLGRPPGRQHIAIDPFQTAVWDDCGLLGLERADLSGYCDFQCEPSCIALPRLMAAKQRVDLAYIDGSHLFEDVFVDFYYTSRMLAVGGVVALDDSSNAHVAKVLRFIRTSLCGSLQEIDLSPFRADRGRSIRYCLARLLGRSQLTAFRLIGSPERAWDSGFVPF